MAPLRDFFQACSFWVFVAIGEDELLTWQKYVCKGLGPPWPPPKAKAGKPNRQALWLRAIYAEVRAGRTLADGVTAAVPDTWLPGDPLASIGVSDAEVGAAGELAKCEAVAKKRKRTAIDPGVKDWFLDYHERMKVEHKWNMRQSWRRAQEMLPSLLENVNEATYYRWTHSDCAKKNKAGRERKRSIAHLTLPGQVCDNLASQVALTSCTYRKIFAAELKKQNVDWTPSKSWVQRFLGANAHSNKKPGVDALKEHGYGVSVVHIAMWLFCCVPGTTDKVIS